MVTKLLIILALILGAYCYVLYKQLQEQIEKASDAERNTLLYCGKPSRIEQCVRNQEEMKENEFTTYRKIRRVVRPEQN